PLPGALADFTGRETERAALAAALCAPAAGVALAVVTGPPGFGKTTLAAQVARDVRGHVDQVLFLDLRGVDPDPVTPDAAVRRVADALGVVDLPPDPHAAADHVRGLLAGRRVLLVLDNAAGEEQVRPLLPPEGGSAVLVTSRRTLAGLDATHRVALDRLTPADSVALLARMLGAGADGAGDLARLAELCADVPLALRIAGHRLATRSGWSVAGLVRRMASDDRRLDALAAGDLRVKAAFTSSYEQLGPGAQRLFRRLALVDAPDTGAGLAAVLVGETLWRTEDLLDELTDLSLVQHHRGDRFQLHDLLRLFARYELDLQEDPATVAAVRASADDWLLATTVRAGRRFEPDFADDPDRDAAATAGPVLDLGGPEGAGAWLRAESGSWLAALRRAATAGDHRRVVDVAEALHWFSDLWSRWGHWPEVFDLSADAATRLGDDRLVATHEGYRAWAQLECRGDAGRAAAAADRALAAARRAGDRAQEGWALSYGSWIAGRVGDLVTAEASARAAVACQLASGDREAAPQALLALASAQSRLGRYEDAVATIREAVALLEDPATRPRAQVAAFTSASAHDYLANALAGAQRWAEARDAATTALGIAADLGVPRTAAASHHVRGRAHAALGDPVAAVADLEAALALRREIGDTVRADLVAEDLERVRRTRASGDEEPSTSTGVVTEADASR
ncbi:ATP-binding protein, partial [Cellulomonas triticagri]